MDIQDIEERSLRSTTSLLGSEKSTGHLGGF